MKKIIILFILLLYNILVSATTVNGRFIVLTNDGTNYSVKLQINTDTGTDDLGSATFKFSFNSDITYPASPASGSDYIFHNFNGSPYGVSTVSRPFANTVYINVELQIDNNGTIVAQTPGWTDLVTINFVTNNSSGSSNLNWSTGSTDVFDGNNATNWTPGTFTPENTHPLPVELSSFTALVNQNAVNLTWQTKIEVNCYGFEIERNQKSEVRSQNNPKSEIQNPQWIKIGFIKGAGNSNSPKDYSYTDKNITGGTKFAYRLKQIDNDGKFSYIDEVEVEIVPTKFELYQNYPNPFNPSTTIRFSLPTASRVSLNIYNILGELITTLLNEDKEGGFYNIVFDGGNFSSGVYIFRLVAGDFIKSRVMNLIK